MSKVPTQPDNERRKRVLDSLPPGTPAPEMDADGNIVGTEDYGGAPLRPEIDANGNIVGTGGPVGKFPPSAGKSIAELIPRWKNWRLNDLQQSLMGLARAAIRRPDQKAHISWVNRYVQSIIDIFPKRGRPPLPQGARTSAQRVRGFRQRKKEQEQREKAWAGMPFPAPYQFPQSPYFVIETAPDEPLLLFDQNRARIVLGYELQQTLDAHHNDYPGQKAPTDQPWLMHQFPYRTEYWTDLVDVKTVVIQYPDKILYITPMLLEGSSIADTLAGKASSSLNRGLFLTGAPHGLGRLISGWGHKKGYNKRISEWQPELEEVDGYFNYEEQSAKMGFADFIEKFGATNESSERKCKLCGQIFPAPEDDLLGSSLLSRSALYDAVLFQHLEEHHPDEFKSFHSALLTEYEKIRKREDQRLRRQMEKQARCTNNHAEMFERQLKRSGPDAYYCECGSPLCIDTHIQQIKETLEKRTAKYAGMSYQDRADAMKTYPKPIRCEYCSNYIYTTEYEPRDRGAGSERWNFRAPFSGKGRGPDAGFSSE